MSRSPRFGSQALFPIYKYPGFAGAFLLLRNKNDLFLWSWPEDWPHGRKNNLHFAAAIFYSRSLFRRGSDCPLPHAPAVRCLIFPESVKSFFICLSAFFCKYIIGKNSLFSFLGHPIIFVEADASPYHQAAGLQKGGPGAKQNAALGPPAKSFILLLCFDGIVPLGTIPFFYCSNFFLRVRQSAPSSLQLKGLQAADQLRGPFFQ